MLYIIYLRQLGKLADFYGVWEEAWNSIRMGFLRNLLARKGFLFCFVLRYKSALSCSLPPAQELRRTGRVENVQVFIGKAANIPATTFSR